MPGGSDSQLILISWVVPAVFTLINMFISRLAKKWWLNFISLIIFFSIGIIMTVQRIAAGNGSGFAEKMKHYDSAEEPDEDAFLGGKFYAL